MSVEDTIHVEVDEGRLNGRRVWVVTGTVPEGTPRDGLMSGEIESGLFYSVIRQPGDAHAALTSGRRSRRPGARGVASVPTRATVRSHRRARSALALAGKTLGSVALAGALAAGASLWLGGDKPHAAQAADPFTNPTWQALAVAGGWQCDAAGADRLQQCTGTRGVTARAEAYTGPDATVFILVYDLDGVTHRDELRVYTDPTSEARILSAAKSDPGAYPNLRTGRGWVMTSTDPELADGVNPDAKPTPPGRGPGPMNAPAVRRAIVGAVAGHVATILHVPTPPAAAPVAGATVATIPLRHGPAAVVVVVPDADPAPTPSASPSPTTSRTVAPTAPTTPPAAPTPPVGKPPAPTPTATVSVVSDALDAPQ